MTLHKTVISKKKKQDTRISDESSIKKIKMSSLLDKKLI